MALKLQQGQVWKNGDEFIRIVRLTRLEVDYKLGKTHKGREGTHHHATKKEFCRLIKSATLLPAGALSEPAAEPPTEPPAETPPPA